MPDATESLTLAPDAPIDLQLHTVHSDGTWHPADLLDHLIAAGFGLAAITDHDRVDTVASLQGLAREKGLPLVVAVEMSSTWQGRPVDFLCYGFDPANNALGTLAQVVTRRQRENTRQVAENLRKAGVMVEEDALAALLAKPAAQQLPGLLALVSPHIPDRTQIGRALLEAGFSMMTHPPAAITEAAHSSGALCILAHPGRTDGFVTFDRPLLDELRTTARIDGIEAYYPRHTPEQTAFYLDYAAQHGLLISAGSDSHGEQNPPIAYPASHCRGLLARLGVALTDGGHPA